ncbi:uncharacterized mitochondrial protein AtMg00860-like [Dioscorea cayenensis subsp. rotundata]|uniref:Uncharacterized mitochondrial protein AtMg00860-like n=1 Tax=Dioscorea cayennensis subsp. rotundata TaxID=55577 RepID=A0AB40AT48_DIOCR|nr:uncharacterized mitochondrial protein AtMg00860-like [Dioscorea cayenensis subsp. rotundata]
MPFGLTNTPSTFMRLMNHPSLDDHIDHLRNLLAVLRKEQLYVNLTKCTFCTNKFVFLGFVVSSQGVEVDEDKIKAVHEWATPQNVSQVRNFLGLAGFYHSFVKDFSTIVAPINEIDNKRSTIQMGGITRKGIGGVLVREGRLISYFSEKLSGPALNYSVYDKELYALARALELANITYGLKIL